MIKCSLILFIVIPATSFEQPKLQDKLQEKFVNDAMNESNYIVFKPDLTFKYRFGYHLFHDISCGHYKLIKYTIFLFYETDLRDTSCNKEIDATIHFDSRLLVFRPEKLFYEDDKLYEIEKGRVLKRTERFQPNLKVPKSSKKYYRRKYFLFGPLISKTKRIHYMVAASKAKWRKYKK